MKINIHDETRENDIAVVYNHTCDIMRQLFTQRERDELTVYIIITNARIPGQTSLAIGACGRVSQTSYIMYIQPHVHWLHTLRHEMFHVLQYYDDLPLDCTTCDQFARLPVDVSDAICHHT